MTDPLSNTLVAWLVFGVLAFFVVGRPAWTWWRVRVPHDPGLVPVLPGDVLPNGLAEFIRSATASLSGVGFTHDSSIWRGEFRSDKVVFLAWFENPTAKDDALVVCAINRAANAKWGTEFVEFRTRYADRLSVRTRNAAARLASGPFPCAKEHVLPEVKEPAALYRAHLAHLDRLGSLAPKDRLGKGTAAGPRLQADWDEELSLARAARLLCRRKDEPFDRLTWWGAFLLSWSGSWPLGRPLDK